jgi:hypothetical protein
MSEKALPEMACGAAPDLQAALPLAAEGVQRFVWQMTHGQILVEVRDGCAYVNGERVEPLRETQDRLVD